MAMTGQFGLLNTAFPPRLLGSVGIRATAACHGRATTAGDAVRHAVAGPRRPDIYDARRRGGTVNHEPLVFSASSCVACATAGGSGPGLAVPAADQDRGAVLGQQRHRSL